MSDVFNTAEDELNFILGNDNVNSSTGQNLNSDGPQYGSYGEEYADPFFDDHNNFEYNASLQEAEEFAANALGVAAAKPSPMAIKQGGSDDGFVNYSTQPSIIPNISRMVSLSPPPAYGGEGASPSNNNNIMMPLCASPIKHGDYTADVGLMLLDDPPVMEDGQNNTLDGFKIDFKSLDDADDILGPTASNETEGLGGFHPITPHEQQYNAAHQAYESSEYDRAAYNNVAIVDAILANLCKNSPPRNNSDNNKTCNEKKRKLQHRVTVPVVHRSIPPSSLLSGTAASASGSGAFADKAKKPPAATKRMPLRKRKVSLTSSSELIQRFLPEPWLDFGVMDQTTLYQNVNPHNAQAKEARRLRRLKRAKGQVVQLVTCGKICGNGRVRDVELMAVQDVGGTAAANLNGGRTMLDQHDSQEATANLNGSITISEDQQVHKEEQLLSDFTNMLDCKTFVDSAWGYVYSSLVESAQACEKKKVDEAKKKNNKTASSSPPTSSASMIDKFLLGTVSDATPAKMDIDATGAKNRVVVTPPSTPRMSTEALKREETLKTLPSGKDPESRKLRRLMRNRLSAQASRDRRKKAIEDAKKLKVVKEQQISALKEQVDVDTKRMVLLERAVSYAKTYLGAEEYDRVVSSNNTPTTASPPDAASQAANATKASKKSNIIQSM